MTACRKRLSRAVGAIDEAIGKWSLASPLLGGPRFEGPRTTGRSVGRAAGKRAVPARALIHALAARASRSRPEVTACPAARPTVLRVGRYVDALVVTNRPRADARPVAARG